MSRFDGLPKLYRAVYVNIDWVEDSNYGGVAHKQEAGQFSIKVRRAIVDDEIKFVAIDESDRYCDKVASFLDELNYDPDPHWLEWSKLPFKHVPASHILNYY